MSTATKRPVRTVPVLDALLTSAPLQIRAALLAMGRLSFIDPDVADAVMTRLEADLQPVIDGMGGPDDGEPDSVMASRWMAFADGVQASCRIC